MLSCRSAFNTRPRAKYSIYSATPPPPLLPRQTPAPVRSSPPSRLPTVPFVPPVAVLFTRLITIVSLCRGTHSLISVWIASCVFLSSLASFFSVSLLRSQFGRFGAMLNTSCKRSVVHRAGLYHYPQVPVLCVARPLQ